MKILLVSPEVTPFAKTGGLADVSLSLSIALKSLGEDIRIVLPFYRVTKEKGFQVKKINENILTCEYKGIPVYFIQNDQFFDREYLYSTPTGDYPDNAERFAYFCEHVFTLCKAINFSPNIFHCHDWQTSLVPIYLKTIFKNDNFFSNSATLLTIHNLAYQGIFEKEKMQPLKLPPDLFHIDGIEYYGKINLLKGGIIFADIINTVSKKYSKEIQTQEFGVGLDGVLRKREKSLFGILNGVDYSEWNPENDKFIIANYNETDFYNKFLCKLDLLSSFSLSRSLSKYPLFGMISRLTVQKGFDLVIESIHELMNMNIVLVILGQGEKKYQDAVLSLKEKYPDRIGVKIAFDEPLAHKIEAGADFFLMPSKYEPCGLNQMYSLKYATIPIVYATGGLDDTIQDFEVDKTSGNGFKFINYSCKDFLEKINAAINVYKDKNLFRKLRRNAMKCDFSWHNSAKEYIELYKKALKWQ
jgi:starch synthase